MTEKIKISRSGAFLVVVGILWASLVIVGFSRLEREEFTPVENVPVATGFPSHSAIPLALDKPTLLLFLHPYCPCSRSSLHELDELLAETQNKVSPIIVFVIPPDIEPGWKQSDLWKSAMATSLFFIALFRFSTKPIMVGKIFSALWLFICRPCLR